MKFRIEEREDFNMRRKSFVILAAAVLGITLAGCGKSTQDQSQGNVTYGISER